MDNEYTTGYMRLKTRIDNIFIENAHKEAITYMRDNNLQLHYSFENILHTVQEWSKELLEYNLIAGDRVAIIAPMMPNTVIAGLALAYANLTAVMLDATLPGEEISRLLEFSDVRGIFTTEEIYSKITSCKENILAIDLMKSGEGIALCQQSISKALKPTTTDPDLDVMVIIFSSGTTSTMKGVMLTYDSILSSREKFVEFSGITAKMNCLIVLPFNHISGYSSSLIYLLTGCGLGLIENLNSTKLQKGLLEYNPYCFGMVPKVYDIMADKIREKIREQGKIAEYFMNALFLLARFFRKNFGLKIGKVILKPVYKKVFGKRIYGLAILGTVCKPETAELFLDFGLEWANLYATTETNPPITSTGVHDRYPLNSVGMVTRFPDIEVKISNPDEKGIGEVLVKTSQIMKGYFREPELTESAFENGYFKTGDLGYIDGKNYLYIVGRCKDTIILHNGKKVSAADIDEYYKSKYKNASFASCGVSNKDGYDEVHLFIETDGLTKEEIAEISHAIRAEATENDLLYKVKQMHLTEKIPVTSVGKVKRYLLKMQVEQSSSTVDVAITLNKVTNEVSIDKEIIQIIKMLCPEVRQEIEDNLRLEELGFDSLELFSLSAEIEKATGVDISGQITGKLTLKELVETVKSENSRDVKDKDTTDYNLLNRSNKDINHAKHLAWFLNRCCKVNYIGLENITEEPCVFVANHSSHLDIMCIYQAIMKRCGNEKLYKVCCLAAEELVQQKGMKKTFHALGAIPVDRKGNATKAFATLNKYIQENGYSAVIFPEGTRTRTGKLGKFTDGVAGAAIMNKVPIIPIGISGTFDIWPATRKRPKLSLFRKIVTVKIGEPVYPTGKDVSEFTGVIREKVEDLLKEKKA